MENGRIAVPSNGQGGLDGTRAGHFGHCDVFTLVDVENGEIKNVSILQREEYLHIISKRGGSTGCCRCTGST